MTDAAAALVRAVAARIAPLPGARVTAWDSRPWASATFSGAQVRLECGLDAERHLPDLIALLHDADLALAGHVLIEMRFDECRQYDGDDGQSDLLIASFTALVLEDAKPGPLAARESC